MPLPLDWKLTCPYAFFVLLTGISGHYIEHEGTSFTFISCIGGCWIFCIGILSYANWDSYGRTYKGYSTAGLVVSSCIALYTGREYYRTGHILSPGLIAGGSIAMMVFYVMTLLAPEQKLDKKTR